MDGIDRRLAALRTELDQVEALLSDPSVLSDRARYVEVTRRHREIEPIVAAVTRREAALGDLEAARELLEVAQREERPALESEVEAVERQLEQLDAEIQLLLLPRDPNDGRNVIVELRGAEGGEEANLWARDLLDMYRGFAQRRGWTFEVMESSPSELGGLAEAVVRLAGEGVWERMKFEAGPHRVQRVPVTESQGRIHTSSATVAVLPEADELEVRIDPNDLDVDVFRSSGPGGQSVNTTDSAVRITHRPTGLVVSMQDQKSQLQNKAKALAVLRARLLRAEQDRAATEAGAAKKAQIGGGGRGEKIRTYNFKENRVTDHRIGFTTYNLDRVLAGDLDEISDALLADERTRLLSESER
jgi:peptide chain release factor 1